MNISDSDIEKIKIITISAQVNSLVSLLSSIDKESLIASINSIKPENRNTVTYRLLLHTLAFYEDVENATSQTDQEDDQIDFNFGDKIYE
jgi:hypothetical protein